MKNFSSRLKKTAPLILLGLILDHSPVHQSAQALVGGPFDDNDYPGSGPDGTYSGTVSGHNLIGVVSFGVSSTQETSGRFSIFHEGFVHYGAATGIADLSSRRVAGSLLGVASLGGSGTSGGGVNVTDSVGGSSGSSPGTATSTGTLTVRDGVEGSFDARIKGYPQAIKFEGQGVLSSNANTAVVSKATLSPTTGVLDAYSIFFPTNSDSEYPERQPSGKLEQRRDRLEHYDRRASPARDPPHRDPVQDSRFPHFTHGLHRHQQLHGCHHDHGDEHPGADEQRGHPGPDARPARTVVPA